MARSLLGANAQVHEHAFLGASPKLMYRERRRCERRNFFEICCDEFISRTMVLYRKFITESATTGTLNVFTFDEGDNSSRP